MRLITKEGVPHINVEMITLWAMELNGVPERWISTVLQPLCANPAENTGRGISKKSVEWDPPFDEPKCNLRDRRPPTGPYYLKGSKGVVYEEIPVTSLRMVIREYEVYGYLTDIDTA